MVLSDLEDQSQAEEIQEQVMGDILGDDYSGEEGEYRSPRSLRVLKAKVNAHDRGCE